MKGLLLVALLSACGADTIKGDCTDLEKRVTKRREGCGAACYCYVNRDPSGSDGLCPFTPYFTDPICTASSDPDVVYFNYVETIDGMDGIVSHNYSEGDEQCVFRSCQRPPG
jgi:hypothetical protein